jgi:tRNA (adenine57-N1/adenine58-N1)-methyltransferase
MKKIVEKGDVVTLIDEKENIYLIDTKLPINKYKGVGVFNPEELINLEYGSIKQIGSKQFRILPISLPDALQGMKRKAQIIIAKDAGQIIINCSITPGKKILEAGIGSGSLTIVLASMIAPNGKVISYDLRQDFIDHAMKNINKIGLTHLVEAKIQDVTEGIDEKELDAVILDIPNPWLAVEHSWKALKPGGFFCSYSPLISQVEQTVDELSKQSFIKLKTIETLEREIIVKKYGSRPSFSMLGHTGYLTFARKII